MGLYTLQQITLRDVAKVGGKAGSLGELLQVGITVPPGFVITTDIQSMTESLKEQILALFDDLKLTRVAVRSSGAGEDAKDQSWAGQFATFLHVDRDGLIGAIQDCWDSAKTARVKSYGKAQSLAVLVQHMIHSDVSGVAFSVNPITRDSNQIMIEAVYGLCEPLVQGTVTPDSFIVNKQNCSIITDDIAEKYTYMTYQNRAIVELSVAKTNQTKSSLSPEQLRELTQLIKRVEKHYSFPVDIEWAYQNNKLYLLQARPITTL